MIKEGTKFEMEFEDEKAIQEEKKNQSDPFSLQLLYLFTSPDFLSSTLFPLLKLKFLKLTSQTALLRSMQLRMRRGVIRVLHDLAKHDAWHACLFTKAEIPSDDLHVMSSVGLGETVEGISIQPFVEDTSKRDLSTISSHGDGSSSLEATARPSDALHRASSLSSVSQLRVQVAPLPTVRREQPTEGAAMMQSVWAIVENELNAYLKEQQAYPEATDDAKTSYRQMFYSMSVLLLYVTNYFVVYEQHELE